MKFCAFNLRHGLHKTFVKYSQTNSQTLDKCVTRMNNTVENFSSAIPSINRNELKMFSTDLYILYRTYRYQAICNTLIKFTNMPILKTHLQQLLFMYNTASEITSVFRKWTINSTHIIFYSSIQSLVVFLCDVINLNMFKIV